MQMQYSEARGPLEVRVMSTPVMFQKERRGGRLLLSTFIMHLMVLRFRQKLGRGVGVGGELQASFTVLRSRLCTCTMGLK